MLLSLETIWVWKLPDVHSAKVFLSETTRILDESDLMVVGCYEPVADLRDVLTHHDVVCRGRLPYIDTFSINRDEYPDAKAFHVHPTLCTIRAICVVLETLQTNGGIDHLAAYRPTTPVVPLLSYRNVGDEPVYCSGLYAKREMDALAKACHSTYSRVYNQQLNIAGLGMPST
jgi:hypothetical protein